MSKVAKIFSIAMLFILSSCYDEEQFSEIPRIEFRSLDFADTQTADSLILRFYFEDGDANVGVTENNFASSYELFVDSEPKVLTAANIDNAVTPIFLAPIVFENVVPVRRDGNTITIIPGSSSFPAFLDTAVYTNNVNDIAFECPNIINQRFGTSPSLLDTIDISIYRVNNSIYEEIVTQEIETEVPALYRERFYNIILIFETNINGTIEEINFREIFNQTDCSLGNFNARIPLFDQDGRSGTITYSIIEPFFRQAFGDDEFRIRFYIYDRSGNKSNEVETPFFRLSEITRN